MILRELMLITAIYLPALGLEKITPIPAGLSSMGLLFLLLSLRVVKVHHFSHIVPLMLTHIALFFIAPAVSILDAMELIKPIGLKLLLLLVVSNFAIISVTGIVVQKLIEQKEKRAC